MNCTKGPWKVARSSNPSFDVCVVAPDGGSICHFTRWPQAYADAHLVSWAPGMLNVLIQSVDIEIKVISERCGKEIKRIEQVRDDIIYGYDPIAIECQKDLYSKMKIIEKDTGKKWEEISNEDKRG